MSNIEWTTVKVTASDGATRSIFYTTARDATLSVVNARYITCTNVTHSGHHSGAKETVRLKIPEEDTKTGSRWMHGTGMMQQVYLN